MLLVVTELCSGTSLTQVLQRNERGMSCFFKAPVGADEIYYLKATEQ